SVSVHCSAPSLTCGKAFDSVSHNSIARCLLRIGVPEQLVGYIVAQYTHASTTLFGNQLPINRGVRQGDPLSPFVFNCLLDSVYPRGWVYPWETGRSLTLAFADDVILLSSSRSGLQAILDHYLGGVSLIGLHPGMNKCASFGIQLDGKRKRWLWDTTPFAFRNQPIPALNCRETYRYLGSEIGMLKQGFATVHANFARKLMRVKNGPLRPQQKLWIVREKLIPSLWHELVFAFGITAGQLEKLDRTSRDFIRQMLHLPKDVSLGFFHSSIKEGGMGIPRISTRVPVLRSKRLDKLVGLPDDVLRSVTDSGFFLKESQKAARWRVKGERIGGELGELDLHRRLLYSSRDGRGLAGVAEASTNSHDWLRGCTALFNGRDFIDSLKLRGNLLATGERKLRGRGTPPCSVGCRVGDSLGHWLQGCPEGHHLRVTRHDKLVNYVASQLVGKGHRVAVEPAIPTPAGMRKPDLVIETRDGSTHVVDVQIVADSAVTSLKAAHERKVAYYNTPPVLEWVDRWRQSTSPRPGLRAEVGSLTISWRGYLAADSSLTMRKLNLGSYHQGVMIVKAMQGSLAIARSRLRRGLRRQPFG
ncbi:Retrovirus-related Pol polyprotein from type-2 retrotransposable element R2DM, partial [Armadillidium vulgare]